MVESKFCSTAEPNFSSRLKFEKIREFLVIKENYLRPYGCSGTDFIAAIDCKNPKTGTEVESLKHESLNTNPIFNKKKYFYFVCDKLVCLQLIVFMINWQLLQTLCYKKHIKRRKSAKNTWKVPYEKIC